MKHGMLVISVLLMISMGCTRNLSTESLVHTSTEEGKLQRFFSMCERDLYRAIEVIAGRELIKNLTHLHRMNAGGKKYYLLERENITEMIKSVTEGVYSDFILVNRHGIVVYTRDNDDLFGKKVTTALIDSPLDHCFKMSENLIHIEDVSAFPEGNGQYNLFISGRVTREGSFHGIFILQLNTGKIVDILQTGTQIIDENGISRITKNSEDMLLPSRIFSQISVSRLKSRGVDGYRIDDEYYNVQLFNFKNLRWIIVEKS